MIIPLKGSFSICSSSGSHLIQIKKLQIVTLSYEKVTDHYFFLQRSYILLTYRTFLLKIRHFSDENITNHYFLYEKFHKWLLICIKKVKVITFPNKRFQIAPLACKTMHYFLVQKKL